MRDCELATWILNSLCRKVNRKTTRQTKARKVMKNACPSSCITRSSLRHSPWAVVIPTSGKLEGASMIGSRCKATTWIRSTAAYWLHIVNHVIATRILIRQPSSRELRISGRARPRHLPLLSVGCHVLVHWRFSRFSVACMSGVFPHIFSAISINFHFPKISMEFKEREHSCSVSHVVYSASTSEYTDCKNNTPLIGVTTAAVPEICMAIADCQ